LAGVFRALRVLKSFSYQLHDGSKLTIDVDALAGSRPTAGTSQTT
jgi:hypothetical protein